MTTAELSKLSPVPPRLPDRTLGTAFKRELNQTFPAKGSDIGRFSAPATVRSPAGRLVYGPGPTHSPTITGALVFYLLPGGAIKFTKQ